MTENRSLYAIDESLHSLLNQAADNAEDMTPEQTDEWLALFEENNLDRKDKIDNVLGYIKSEESWQVGIDIEIERLMEIKASSKRKSDNLLKYVQLSMKNAGESELKTSRHILKFGKNPASMKMTDGFSAWLDDKYKIKSINAQLKTAKAGLALEKNGMKIKLKAGEEVEGVWLEQGEKFTVK